MGRKKKSTATKKTSKKVKPVDDVVVDTTPSKVFVKRKGPPSDPTQPWIDEDGTRYLARTDLLEINNLRQQIDLQVTESQVLRLKAAKLEMDAAQQVAGMRQTAISCEGRKRDLESEYKALTDRLGTEYGIDFKTIGYDDVNGKVTDLS